MKNGNIQLQLLRLGYTYLVSIEKDQFTTEKSEKHNLHVGSEKKRKVLLKVLLSLLDSLITENLRKVEKKININLDYY